MTSADYKAALTKYHDKHERITGLMDIHGNLDHATFWRLFRDVWTGSESLFLHQAELRRMLTQERLATPERFEHAMDEAERAWLRRAARRGKPVKIYRGGCQANLTGFSWTTSMAVAERFANGCPDANRTISIGRVPHDQIIMFCDGSEREVVTFPELVEIEEVKDHPAPADERAMASRTLQVAVQAKGINAAMNMTPAEYWTMQINMGTRTRQMLVDYFRETIAACEPLGFKSRVATARSILEAIEEG